MHNSAKNMTYISQEGVDMDGDMDRGALSSSNCNTVDIISTFFFKVFLQTQILAIYPTAKKSTRARFFPHIRQYKRRLF